MTKMRKRILGIGCAALFALSNIAVSMFTAFPAGISVSAAASATSVQLKAYGGKLSETSVTLQADGTLPELPVPTREGYDFVGWFTQPVEVNYWGDEESELDGSGISWKKLKETYGASAGYKYLNGRPTSWYDIAEKPDPNIADDAGYWTNSRWIENSVGLMNATKGDKAEKGTAVADGSKLYAMYDPKNITVYWYNNGWNDVHDAWAVTTGRSFGTEYGSKFAYLPLNDWDPWKDHEFKGWVDENGKAVNFDLDSKCQLTKEFYTPKTYSPILRLYAMYDNVTQPEGKPENAKFDRVIGSGGYFDPNKSSYTFTAVFDSRYKIYPDIKWEIVSGSEFFSLSVSADKTSATVTAKPALQESYAEPRDTSPANQRVDVRLTVGGNSYDVYATAAHEWNNGKILSGQWDPCNEPLVVEYKCRNCDQTYTHVYPPDEHRYTVYRHEATCTEDATVDRYCVVCGKSEHEILEGTATGHTFNVVKSSGCGGTITTSTCKSCGLVHTEEDHTACHSWNSDYTIDRAATCTTEGSKSIHCKNCNAVKESATIPATGHSYKETRHNATCTESGYIEKVCSSCGDRVTETISDPTGHDYQVETRTGCNGMTCTVKTCRFCGDTETIGDPDALAHVPAQEYVVEKTPTCTAKGEKTLRCAVCDVVLERKEIPATGHNYQIETHEATCTAGAYEVHTCTVCGDSFTKTTSAPKGHNFDVKTQTGCGGAQYTTKTCLTCGEVETEGELNALEHTPAADYVVEKAPTCTAAGEKVLRCTKCNIVLEKEEVPAAGHNYQIATHEATCTAGAYEVHTCTACGDSFTETTSAPKGHNFKVETQTGCNGAEYTTKTCLTCGEVETEGELAALDHTPAADYVVEKAASCTVAGEKVLHCAKCNVVLERKEIPATGHSYEATKHDATCTENGYTVYTCSACQDSYTEQTSAPKGHNFKVETQTGCNGAEYTTKTCLTCGEVKTEGNLAALDHTPAEYVVEKAPTCTVAGEKVLRCAKCNVVLDRQEVSATGHDYQPVVHEATCTENGYTVYTCSVCQDSYTKQTSAPNGHNFKVETQTGCNGAQYTTKTCLTCGAVETEGELEALAHTPAAEYVVEKTPTCTEAGEKVLRCTKCNIVLNREEVSATGHSYEETEHAATCTEAGYIERICSACGDSVTEITSDPIGHIENTVTEREATCFEDGLKTVRCATCGCLLESETLPADPSLHVWSEWETKTEGSTIVKSRACEVCGEREETVTQAEPQEQETVPEPAPQVQETVPEVVPQVQETVTEPAPQKEQQSVTPSTPEEAAKSVAHTAPAENVEETLDSGARLSAALASHAGNDEKSAAWLPITFGTIGGTAVLALAAYLILKRRKAGK